MKYINTFGVNRTLLSKNGLMALTTIESLQMKARMEGGLQFRDEYELNAAHKMLQVDIDRINNPPPAEDTEQLSENEMPIGSPVDEMKVRMDAMIEQLKKLPTHVDPVDAKEPWAVNPRYAEYLRKNPPERTVTVDISRAKRK